MRGLAGWKPALQLGQSANKFDFGFGVNA